MGTATMVCRALGIPLDAPSCVACDLKPHAQHMLNKQMAPESHIVASLGEHADGAGWCFKHLSHCTLPSQSPDVLVLGPPCQPYTDQRSDHHQTGYVDHPGTHASLGSGHDSVFDLISKRRPGVVLIENVTNFAREDPKTHEVPAIIFAQMLRTLKDRDGKEFYPAMHIVDLTPHAWLQMDRSRTAAG